MAKKKAPINPKGIKQPINKKGINPKGIKQPVNKGGLNKGGINPSGILDKNKSATNTSIKPQSSNPSQIRQNKINQGKEAAGKFRNSAQGKEAGKAAQGKFSSKEAGKSAGKGIQRTANQGIANLKKTLKPNAGSKASEKLSNLANKGVDKMKSFGKTSRNLASKGSSLAKNLASTVSKAKNVGKGLSGMTPKGAGGKLGLALLAYEAGNMAVDAVQDKMAESKKAKMAKDKVDYTSKSGTRTQKAAGKDGTKTIKVTEKNGRVTTKVINKEGKEFIKVTNPKASENKSSKKDSTKPGGNISNKTSNPPIQNQPKKDFTKAFNDLKKGASGSTAQKGKDPIKENFEKMRNTKPSETKKTETTQKPKTTAGPTVAELWKQKTGMNWSEAKKQGVSDGSYASNTKLMKDLKAGKYDKKEPVGTLKLKSAQLMESGTKTPTELAKSSKFKMGGKKVSMRKGMPLYKKGGVKKYKSGGMVLGDAAMAVIRPINSIANKQKKERDSRDFTNSKGTRTQIYTGADGKKTVKVTEKSSAIPVKTVKKTLKDGSSYSFKTNPAQVPGRVTTKVISSRGTAIKTSPASGNSNVKTAIPVARPKTVPNNYSGKVGVKVLKTKPSTASTKKLVRTAIMKKGGKKK